MGSLEDLNDRSCYFFFGEEMIPRILGFRGILDG